EGHLLHCSTARPLWADLRGPRLDRHDCRHLRRLGTVSSGNLTTERASGCELRDSRFSRRLNRARYVGLMFYSPNTELQQTPYLPGTMARKNRTPAVAYLRTSSSTNVGADKDSDKRQRAAIEAFAKHAGFEIVAELYNQAVSGADPIDARPAFAAM